MNNRLALIEKGGVVQMKQSQSKVDPQILTLREQTILELVAEGYKN